MTNYQENLVDNRYNKEYTVNFSGKILDHLSVYINSIMRSAILCYKLQEPSFVRINILAENQKKVKEMTLIPGNPGGRKGENKVLWDGTNQYGVKVPFAKYTIFIWVNNKQVETLKLTF